MREVNDQERIPHFSQVRITDSSITNGFVTWAKKQHQGKPPYGNEFTDVLRELILQYADIKTPLQPKQSRHSIVALVCDYIETNLNQIIRLDEMADVTHLSPFYLNRIFREEIGIPPYAYLLQIRIKKSLEILLQTNSITEATHYLGFTDQSHFTRLFKKNIGITPKRFLDLHRTGTH